MSITAMNWVWRHSKSKATDRLVLLAIADNAQEDTLEAWPKLDTLVRKTGLVRTTVRAAIARLVALGELEVTPNAGGSLRHEFYSPRHRPDLYFFPLVRGTCATSEGHLSNVREGQQPSLTYEEQSEGQPSLEPSFKVNTLVPAMPGPVAVVFASWVAATGKTDRTALTDQRRGVIERALKTYPVEDLTDAVRGWRYSPHHCGDNEHGTIYNDLGLLLRDASHIEKFRDLERDGPYPVRSRAASAVDRVFDRLDRLETNGSRP